MTNILSSSFKRLLSRTASQAMYTRMAGVSTGWSKKAAWHLLPEHRQCGQTTPLMCSTNEISHLGVVKA